MLDPDLGRLTMADRVARGKAARGGAAGSHAALDLPFDRPDPVDLLELQAQPGFGSWCRCATAGCWPRRSRTSAAPRCRWPVTWPTPVTGMTVQACGDAHLSNFGVFGSPERRLVFDINDFDETLPGAWEWDVKRLAASIEIAGRENGFSQAAQEGRPGRGPPLPRGDARLRRDDQPGRLVRPLTCDLVGDVPSQPRFRQAAQEARSGPGQGQDQGQHAGADEAARVVDGQPRIVADPPLIVPAADLAGDEGTADFQAMLGTAGVLPAHAARRDAEPARPLPGRRPGQEGRRRRQRRHPLLDPACSAGAQTALFLQVKEAERSVLSEFAGASQYDNHGQRVVIGQRFTQAASDVFLGWVRVEEGSTGGRTTTTPASCGTGSCPPRFRGMPPTGARYAGFAAGHWPVPTPGLVIPSGTGAVARRH